MQSNTLFDKTFLLIMMAEYQRLFIYNREKATKNRTFFLPRYAIFRRHNNDNKNNNNDVVMDNLENINRKCERETVLAPIRPKV